MVDMIDFLYANGCSWTHGNGLDTDPLFTKIPESPKKTEFVNKYRWPDRLASYIKCDLLNDGWGAGSNNRIIRTTCEFLQNYPKEKYKNLLVALAWTTIERNEIFLDLEETNIKDWFWY